MQILQMGQHTLDAGGQAVEQRWGTEKYVVYKGTNASDEFNWVIPASCIPFLHCMNTLLTV